MIEVGQLWQLIWHLIRHVDVCGDACLEHLFAGLVACVANYSLGLGSGDEHQVAMCQRLVTIGRRAFAPIYSPKWRNSQEGGELFAPKRSKHLCGWALRQKMRGEKSDSFCAHVMRFYRAGS